MTLVVLGEVRAINAPYMFPLGYCPYFCLTDEIVARQDLSSKLIKTSCLRLLLKYMALQYNYPIGCILYYFSIAVVPITTNLVTQNNVSILSHDSGGQKLEMGFIELKSRCQQTCVPSAVTWGKSVTLPYLASRDLLHSLAPFPPSSNQLSGIFKSLTLSRFYLPSPSWRPLLWLGAHLDNPRFHLPILH